jgi:hypothetical protein
MLIYDGITILNQSNNFIIDGVKSSYNFLQINPKSAIERLTGDKVVCLASIDTADEKENFFVNFTHINYQENLVDFFKLDDWFQIRSMFFMSVKSKEEAEKIIQDIKLKHPSHFFNSK